MFQHVVNGLLVLPSAPVSFASSTTVTDLATYNRTVLDCTSATGNVTLNSVVAVVGNDSNGPKDGQVLVFFFRYPFSTTIKHLSGAAGSSNYQFQCPAAADLVLSSPPGGGYTCLTVVYNATINKWLVVAHS